MKNKMIACILCCFIVFLPTLQAERVTKSEMIENVDAMKGFLRCKYGPIHWKKEYANWDLEREIENAKTRIHQMQKISVKGFQVIYRDLFSSLKDYHVNTRFYCTERAFLPLEIKKISGRYLVTAIKRDLLPAAKFPFQVGDEIVCFDGKPIEELVALIKADLGGNVEETDQSMAEGFLTMRLGTLGHQVPKGNAILTFGKAGHVNVGGRKFMLEWIYTPEYVKAPEVSPIRKALASNLPRFLKSNELNQMFSLPLKQAIEELDGFIAASPDNPNAIGLRQSYLPPLGTIIWETGEKNPFHSYIYLNQNDRKIGYLRIPSYGFSSEEAGELVKIIKKLEGETEALVFDQINNPGGNVFFAYGVASMLANKPIRCFKQSVVLTQEEFMNACLEYAELDKYYSKLSSGNSYVNIHGYLANKTAIKEFMDYNQFLIKQWTDGKFYSDDYYLWGFSKIMPHPESHYTKPILMLISELDFSCGDILPALLKDNKRALLMGVRTGGAGGYVIEYKYPNRLGVQSFSLTGSLMRRNNGQPIENLGIQPDIPYELSEDDIKLNYIDYVNLINQTVDQM